MNEYPLESVLALVKLHDMLWEVSARVQIPIIHLACYESRMEQKGKY